MKSVEDFKRYDLLYNSASNKLFKCTVGNNVREISRSTTGSILLKGTGMQYGYWYNMGTLDDLYDALKRKAKKDIANM